MYTFQTEKKRNIKQAVTVEETVVFEATSAEERVEGV